MNAPNAINAGPAKNSTIVQDLPLSLEELYNGSLRKIKVSRKVGLILWMQWFLSHVNCRCSTITSKPLRGLTRFWPLKSEKGGRMGPRLPFLTREIKAQTSCPVRLSSSLLYCYRNRLMKCRWHCVHYEPKAACSIWKKLQWFDIQGQGISGRGSHRNSARHRDPRWPHSQDSYQWHHWTGLR